MRRAHKLADSCRWASWKSRWRTAAGLGLELTVSANCGQLAVACVW